MNQPTAFPRLECRAGVWCVYGLPVDGLVRLRSEGRVEFRSASRYKGRRRPCQIVWCDPIGGAVCSALEPCRVPTAFEAGRRAVERRVRRQWAGVALLRALGGTLACVVALAGCYPDDTSDDSGQGILTSQTTDARYRYCTYSDGFILTVGKLDRCPLTD